ncbi:MAG TPA: TIGR04255 family protein [Candidatus Wujingus californicus]|uniref:TIGR04255 family protein n=1 Tax=Candidatus Wujingus californicus TaxID=3367618 RepID=UPI001E14E43B|nr:TIGR04255 family protein [Planctomycetota bacterium]MDO8131415.1 TIGR04255 family protein [Candidatus Brocadiales bacterium]
MPKNIKSEIYPNSPLVEVIFEIRFPADPVVECKRDVFFDFVRKDYAQIFVPQTKEGSFVALEPYRFAKEDRSSGIMLSINRFSYYSRKYPGFALFKKEIIRLIDIFKKSYPTIKKLTRTGFRYVNIIPFTREQGIVPLDKYLNVKLQLPSLILGKYNNISVGLIAKTNGGSITTRIETLSATDKSGEAILLDIDFAKEDDLSMVNVKKYLDESHNYSRQLFEDLITDMYRIYLRGESI